MFSVSDVAVIGLGYVGLPLAAVFAKRFHTIGFDSSQSRIRELNSFSDKNNSLDTDVLRSLILSNRLAILYDVSDIKDCNFYIVTVPTPVDEYNRPDLRPLLDASALVGSVISRGDVVVYESTVYPGVTEEECVPVLENVSGLKFNVDFFVGYSPERINPGDSLHTVENICKVTSGSTPEVADFIDSVYASVIKAGTHKAPSIRVAEAAKIIENTQRDVNIAFMNELSKIFNAMEIDTQDVIDAASTKWNFMRFKPGLVGGHCISVDPYYLIQKAQVHGVMPRIITEARRLNDSMGEYVASQVIKLMNKNGVLVKDSRILILGFTFKENCPDIRNTKVADIIASLSDYNCQITVVDPWVNHDDVRYDFPFSLESNITENMYYSYDAVVLCVAHREFNGLKLRNFLRIPNGVVYDVKSSVDRNDVDGRL